MMTSIGIAYIVCGIVYLIACIMDGQDVKPLWKKWLGVKLANVADYYYPIDYCNRDKCFYPKRYRTALKNNRELRGQLQLLQTRANIPLQQTTFDAVRIESNICIGEDEVFRANSETEMARRYGYPIPARRTVDGLVENGRQNILDAICTTIKKENVVNIDIDKESRYPAILMRGWLYVGRKRD